MSVLIIDGNVKAQLTVLKHQAEAHKIGRFMIQSCHELKRSPVPDQQRLEIPGGWTVAFTIEEHPGGWMRHLSMVSPVPGRIPTPDAAALITPLLGFLHNPQDCQVWIEDVGPHHKAINLVEPYQPCIH